ncbi:MAG: hypothetical protein EAZ30_00185 [Betaproteobacteria bacterium]|nr:MAG: hypothetical protein EAZ30_00185 [Betaproteobacteria bacterium]
MKTSRCGSGRGLRRGAVAVNFQALPWQTNWLAASHELTQAHHHAWIVSGRDGDGLSAAGAALAALLLCESPVNSVACGQCGSCKWLAGDAHPDFMRLAPQESDDEVSRLPIIKIDAAREAVEFMQLSASTRRGRVLLVDSANALSRDSANALLKALEEPPADTRWLLVSAHPARLLATIRSRALKLRLSRPAQSEALAWLVEQGMDRPAAALALAATRGSPLAALAVIQSGGIAATADFLKDLSSPKTLPTLSWGSWVDSGGKTDRRARFGLLLSLLVDWTADWARVRSGLAPLRFDSHRDALAKLAQALPLASALGYHRSLLRQLGVPDTTLSARLQIEGILLDYRTWFSR